MTAGSAAPPPVQPPSAGGAGVPASVSVAGSGGMLAAGASGGSAAADSGRSGSSAGAAATAGAGAEARVPMFQKTDCIDPSKLKAGVEMNFPCNGVELWVAMPSQCQTRACGLIFNIHGGAMTDHATMDQATNMIALGNKADYIVMHPHRASGSWDVGSDKDVVFGLLQQAIQAFDVDRKRVHSTGYSQGGQISWALGCEHADVVASIAPAEEINRVSDCWKPSKLPARELPILFAYGRQDSIGGGYAGANTQATAVATAGQMMGPDTIAGTETAKYWRQRWTSKTGNVLEFISHNYSSALLAGHCLPMSTGTTFVSCSVPVDYDWGKEAVLFFQAHPMQ